MTPDTICKRNALAAIVIGAVVMTPFTASTGDEDEKLNSPRLAVLAHELQAGNAAALDAFWLEMKGRAPLVEPMDGDARCSWVTFVWREKGRTDSVSMFGVPPDGQPQQWLSRLRQTNLWYRTERLPNDARFLYGFRVNMPVKIPEDEAAWTLLLKECPMLPDPLNSRNENVASLVELRDAPPQPWLPQNNSIAGWLNRVLPQTTAKQHSIRSEILGQERTLSVYLPSGYSDAAGPYPLLVLFDGPSFQQTTQVPAPAILDDLIAHKKIPPVVAVFVNPVNREKELACSEPFADFLAKELVPWVRTRYRISENPQQAIVGGFSFGGLMAAYCAFRHADVFGNVLSLSGSHQWAPGFFVSPPPLPYEVEPGWLIQKYLAAERRPVRFFLAAGRFENMFPISLLAANRHFRDVLLAKGYSVEYREFSGGHDPAGWRSPFADGLIALTSMRDVK